MAGLERAVVLVNDLAVRGRLRLHKYGFIAAHPYKKDLECLGFYRDWKARGDGPYSRGLAEDLGSCVEAGIIDEARRTTPGGSTIYVYTLRPKGRRMLRRLAKGGEPLKADLHKRFAGLDRKGMSALLKDACKAHPEYAADGGAKGGAPKGAGADADGRERFNPEIEAILQSIDSGTFVGKEYTIDEYIKYVKAMTAC